MEYKKVLVAFVLLFAIGLVNAQPFQQGANQDLTEGYVVQPTNFEYHNISSDRIFHVHVLNISNGNLLSNSTTTCRFHLIIDNGTTIIDSVNMSYDVSGNDFEYNVLSGNFTYRGDYSYLILCEELGGVIGGYYYGVFRVNNVGEGFSEGIAIFYIGLLSILIFLFIVTIAGISKLPSGNRGEGELISISYLKYVRDLLYVVAYVEILIITFVTSNVFKGYFISEMGGQLMLVIYQVLFWLMIPMLIIWLIYLFARIFQDRELKNILDRGLMEDYSSV